jgi:hypothetical protein
MVAMLWLCAGLLPPADEMIVNGFTARMNTGAYRGSPGQTALAMD